MQTSNKKYPLYALTTLVFTFLTLLVAASPNWFQQMDEAIYHIKWQLNAPLLTAVNLLAKTATIGPMLLFFLLLMVYLLRKKKKNWLMNNDSFNLYQQAPALVDSILATLPVVRVSPHEEDFSSAPGNISPCAQSVSMVCALTGLPNR